MDNISTSPASARTDVLSSPEHTLRTPSTTTVRRIGLGLAAGTATWAAVTMVYGFSPDSESGIKITDLGGLVFQAGVLGLLHLQMWTRAAGTKAISRRLLKLERVLLALAMLWSVLHAFLPSQREAGWLLALDAFWPLSMLGMFFIGIKVALAGRWRGPARTWSCLAETWAPVCVPLIGILGHGAGDYVAAGHLLAGYTVLGVIIAARPELVEDRG